MFKKSTIVTFLGSFVTIMVFFVSSVWATVDISEIPLDAQTKAAPASIMFVLDNSGSMDWEMMTVESDGLFSGARYVFNNPGDNLYSGILTAAQRMMWKSQWLEHNKMYYNPMVTYTPWPSLPDANTTAPRSHPYIAANYFNISTTYVQLPVAAPTGGTEIIIDDLDTAPGSIHFSTPSGVWTQSAADPAEYNGSSLYSTSAGAEAQWDFTLPVGGDYQVWAWWASVAGWQRDTNARYRVAHSVGDTDYYRNMTVDFGQWNLLGAHSFNAGTNSITLLRGNSTINADAVKLVPVAAGTINVPRAHYYTYSFSESRPYLITIDGSINYYAVTVTGTGNTESVSYVQLVTNPPADVKTDLTYTEARQNFANWYSFYRRRELTATAAVSNVISQMAGVQIGITTINHNIAVNTIQQPVVRIKVGGVDNTGTLLSTLYSLGVRAQGTPLRTGLQDAGQYFDRNDSNNTGGIGTCSDNQYFPADSTCPYWAAADGGECQQAFAIVMTDGYYGTGSPGVGNVDDNYTYVDSTGVTQGPHIVPFADGYSDTLADVAMYYWSNDLSTGASGLDNLISPSAVDPADYQHMVTYGVSFGVTGTLDPANYDLSASPPPTIPWTNPWSGNPEKIDDLYHSSVNGHGTFLSASNPMELVNSLLAIMQNIKQRIGSASSVSVNGDELYKRIDENTYMFQSSYNTTGWLGDINSYKVDSSTGAIDLTNPAWSASTVWQAESWATYWNTTRSIVTYSGSAGVPFRIGSLTTAQEILLDPTPATAQLVLNYVRGDDSNEQINGGTFRNRSSRLGDIVHSSPIYHNGILYTGANDGMMHAIRAEEVSNAVWPNVAGKELFSYIPSQVITNLSKLTDPTYGHNYYVDLTVTVEDNVLGANSSLLVGGLGQGGIGYYALDISNLSSLTVYDPTPLFPHSGDEEEFWASSPVTEAALAGRVLWEFPNLSTHPNAPGDLVDDLSDIGYSFSKSLIVKTNNTAHPWAVIFGNGYNSIDGQSVLFILDPANGDVLRKIELGSGPDNGLSTPSVTDVNGDGKADYAYAGDLAGNMWKIDLTDPNISNWGVAFAHGGSDAPLFTATGPTGITQPITSKPDVMFHPQYHGYMVAFGTGKFLGTTDFLDKTVQTVYGIWDYGDDSDDTENLGTFIPATRQVSELSSHSTLLEQGLLVPDFTYDPDSTVTGDEEIVRVLTDHAISWVIELDSTSGESPNPSTTVDNNAGWYFDLPNPGERVVSRMMIRDGKAIFISFTPESAPCSTGGDSILHEVDAADGSRANTAVFDTNGDGVVNTNDLISVKDASGNVVLDANGNALKVSVTGIQREGHLQTPAILKLGGEEIKYMSSTAGNIETVKEAAAKTGVSSWREF